MDFSGHSISENGSLSSLLVYNDEENELSVASNANDSFCVANVNVAKTDVLSEFDLEDSSDEQKPLPAGDFISQDLVDDDVDHSNVVVNSDIYDCVTDDNGVDIQL